MHALKLCDLDAAIGCRHMVVGREPSEMKRVMYRLGGCQALPLNVAHGQVTVAEIFKRLARDTRPKRKHANYAL